MSNLKEFIDIDNNIYIMFCNIEKHNKCLNIICSEEVLMHYSEHYLIKEYKELQYNQVMQLLDFIVYRHKDDVYTLNIHICVEYYKLKNNIQHFNITDELLISFIEQYYQILKTERANKFKELRKL
jgi:hypothetical protein